MTAHFTGLPSLPALAELQSRPQWVAWKLDYRNGPDKKPTKPPVSPKSGFGASHSNPATWGTYQEALQIAVRRNLPGVGYVISADDDYTGIDLDGCVGPDGDLEPWAKEIVDLAETYCEISPSGNGLRLIARGKIDKTVKCDPAHVEIYRDSRYLTITGSHYLGTPTGISPAPKTIAALLARVEVMRPAAPTVGSSATAMITATAPLPDRQIGSDFFSNVNTRALSCLPLWVPTILPAARFHASTGAFRVSSKSLNRDLQEDLSLAPDGIVDFGVHDMGDARDGKRTPIDICIEYGNQPDAKSAAFWLCAKLGTTPENMGWAGFDTIPDDGYDTRQLLQAADGTVHDAATGEVIDLPTELDEDLGGALDYYDLPDDHLTPPGVVGDIVNWICETTGEPIRVHALGAALVTVGTLLARKVYSKSRPTGTHLYIGAIAPSGFGKDHPQACIKMLLDNITGVGNPLHIAWAGSAPKLGQKLIETAGCVMVADEFAEKFAGTRSRNASVSTAAINETFKEIWGRSHSSYSVPTALTRSDATIQKPGMSFYGAATISDFKESLVSKDVTSGLYNRFMFLPRYKEVDTAPEMDGLPHVPERLAARCAWLYNCVEPIHVQLAVRGDGYPPNPILVPFSPEADAMNEANRVLQKSMQRMADDDAALSLYGRYAEQIKRIAMIIACGRSVEIMRNAIIEAGDMLFAARLVRWSIEQSVLMVRHDMVENWIEANRNKVLGYIRKRKTVKRSEVLRRVRSVKGKDLDEIIRYLREAECIEEFKMQTDGRHLVCYRYMRG